jgi:hypothetical protein
MVVLVLFTPPKKVEQKDEAAKGKDAPQKDPDKVAAVAIVKAEQGVLAIAEQKDYVNRNSAQKGSDNEKVAAVASVIAEQRVFPIEQKDNVVSDKDSPQKISDNEQVAGASVKSEQITLQVEQVQDSLNKDPEGRKDSGQGTDHGRPSQKDEEKGVPEDPSFSKANESSRRVAPKKPAPGRPTSPLNTYRASASAVFAMPVTPVATSVDVGATPVVTTTADQPATVLTTPMTSVHATSTTVDASSTTLAQSASIAVVAVSPTAVAQSTTPTSASDTSANPRAKIPSAAASAVIAKPTTISASAAASAVVGLPRSAPEGSFSTGQSIRALFDFSRNQKGYVTMTAREILTVVKSSPQLSATGWVLVKNVAGMQGYVPINYVKLVE